MKSIKNPIYHELKKLKLISSKNLIKISSKTRDKNIAVYQDKKTKIIFLEKFVTNSNYYNLVKYAKIRKINNKKIILTKTKKRLIKSHKLNDDLRRVHLFNKYCRNKDVLDFGCGWGGFLSNVKKLKSYNAVELRNECVDFIKKNNKKINIFKNIDDFNKNFDLITMFHVLEHIPYQIKTLKLLNKKIKKGGKIIIEVPHAEDFLILQDELKEFKDFTFWSEHLILHTIKSLRKVLSCSGFKNINIKCFQRYNFSNHLGWFINRKPGGHDFFKQFGDSKLSYYYSKKLIDLKQTDTLIAIAEKK